MTILDAKKLENNKNLECDICIVGAGMSGQIVASKINKKKIIIIDSGGTKYDKEIQNLNDLEIKSLKLRENHKNRIRQLGGSANLWANQLMFLDKIEVENRDWLDNDLSWPINYNEIKQNYSEVIKDIFNYNLYKFYKNDYYDEKINNSYFEEEIFKEKNISFKKHLWPHKVETFSINSSFTKKIITKKNIDFLQNCTATNFIIDQEKAIIKNLSVETGDKKFLINAKVFVLSCGAIENARILLNNQIKYKILINNNTGKYFMDHPRRNLGVLKSKKKLLLSSLFGIKSNSFDFRKSICISEDYQRKNKILNSHAYLDPDFDHFDELMYENFLKEIKKLIKLNGVPKINFNKISLKKILQQIYFKMPPQVSSSYLNNLIRIWLSKKNNYLSFSKIKINYQGEQLPCIDSKILLSDKKDLFNQHRAILDWKLNKIDYETQNAFINILKNMFKFHSYLSFEENNENEITDASHHSGTTRISSSKSSGVVDRNCKFHDIFNLYISGSSIFRTIGSGNPGLTNMAISNRLGKYINNL